MDFVSTEGMGRAWMVCTGLLLVKPVFSCSLSYNL